MTDKWNKWEKLCEYEISVSLLNEPIEPEEPKTALERAHRRWGMEREPKWKEPTQ